MWRYALLNVVIVTHWTDGDVIPFINLAEFLIKKGNKVTILTHCIYESMVISVGADFVPWETKEQYKIFINELNSNILFANDYNSIMNFRNKFENDEIKINECSKILNCCKSNNTIILAKNRSSLSAFMVSEKYKIPLVCCFMNPYEPFSMIAFDQIYGSVLTKQSNDLRKKYGLSEINSWLQWQSSPKVNIAFWPEWFFCANQNWRNDISNVGFPINANSVRNDMQNNYSLFDNKPILITGGTGKMLSKKFFSVCIQACSNFDKKVIVLTKYKEMIPENLPNNVYWVDYIPNLNHYLDMMSVVIHHGGIGTLSGSILAGVPQLILGEFVDRPFNGSRAKELGIAEYLPPALWNVQNVYNCIIRLFSGKINNQCKIFSSKIKKEDTFGNVERIIEAKDDKFVIEI